METTNPALAAAVAADKSWWQRNRRWFVPGLILSPVLLCCLPLGGCIMIASRTVRGHESYQIVFDTVQGSPAVRDALGEPIEDNWWVCMITGNLTVGPLQLAFHVTGPKGKAEVQAQCVNEAGVWVVNVLRVRPEGQSAIDLLGTQMPSSSIAPGEGTPVNSLPVTPIEPAPTNP